MRVIEELKEHVLQAYKKAQEARSAGERARWLEEYQRLYRALKVQEAIVFG